MHSETHAEKKKKHTHTHCFLTLLSSCRMSGLLTIDSNNGWHSRTLFLSSATSLSSGITAESCIRGNWDTPARDNIKNRNHWSLLTVLAIYKIIGEFDSYWLITCGRRLKRTRFLKITLGIRTYTSERSHIVSLQFSEVQLWSFGMRQILRLNSQFTHLLALPPQWGKEVTEGVDALQLNDKKEHEEDCTLHWEGHE